MRRGSRRGLLLAAAILALVPGAATAQQSTSDPDLYRPAPKPKPGKVPDRVKEVAPDVSASSGQVRQGVVVAPPVSTAAQQAAAAAAAEEAAARRLRAARLKRLKQRTERRQQQALDRDRAAAERALRQALEEQRTTLVPVAKPLVVREVATDRGGGTGGGQLLLGLLLGLGLPVVLVGGVAARSAGPQRG